MELAESLDILRLRFSRNTLCGSCRAAACREKTIVRHGTRVQGALYEQVVAQHWQHVAAIILLRTRMICPGSW
jgi:hypothetical protein